MPNPLSQLFMSIFTLKGTSDLTLLFPFATKTLDAMTKQVVRLTQRRETDGVSICPKENASLICTQKTCLMSPLDTSSPCSFAQSPWASCSLSSWQPGSLRLIPLSRGVCCDSVAHCDWAAAVNASKSASKAAARAQGRADRCQRARRPPRHRQPTCSPAGGCY